VADIQLVNNSTPSNVISAFVNNTTVGMFTQLCRRGPQCDWTAGHALQPRSARRIHRGVSDRSRHRVPNGLRWRRGTIESAQRIHLLPHPECHQLHDHCLPQWCLHAPRLRGTRPHPASSLPDGSADSLDWFDAWRSDPPDLRARFLLGRISAFSGRWIRSGNRTKAPCRANQHGSYQTPLSALTFFVRTRRWPLRKRQRPRRPATGRA
jgi:hypothetical protein